MAGGNAPFGFVPSGELTAYTPTLRERAADWLRSTLFTDDREGQDKANRLTNWAETMIPPFGFATQAYDAGRAGGMGDYGTAGVLGAMAFLPGPDVKSFKAFKGMHGTSEAGDAIDLALGRSQHSWDKGNVKNAGFFASNPDVASYFADALSRDAKTVFPTELSFNNPLIIDGGGQHAADFQFGKNKAQWDAYFSDPRFAEFDGVILKNVKDAGGVTDIYVPKDPEQIKHTIGGK